MQKQKENLFLDKFRLLNSQEHIEEIIWSPSDSSEYEELALDGRFSNLTNKTRILKRKRKKKVSRPKSVSNLNITVLDTSKSTKELQILEKSPILVSKRHQKSLTCSPILASSQTRKHQCNTIVQPLTGAHQKSPILIQNHSPKTAGNVKKKLFTQSEIESQNTISVKSEINSEGIKDNIITDVTSRVTDKNTLTVKSELISKVKQFFDNHFSSESSSQNSEIITEIQTQGNSTKTSDELEILTCKTQVVSSNCNSIKSFEENQPDQSIGNYYSTNKQKKKIRYKKDGLAYRFDNLLRKRNACLSLWHHERYLAANSNFIIPKGENTVFRIKKIQFKYGCYLLEVADLYECGYLVLINNCYVSDTLLCDTVIKIYEPYKVVQYNESTKLLVNVCRFECSQYKA